MPLKRLSVAVAVSGGVDSLCALALLKKSGHQVFALHGRFLHGGDWQKLEDLDAVCSRLGVKFYAADLIEDFDRLVINPFLAEYQSGLTPNPCARCNKAIKFGKLLQTARMLGADCIATGHYARLEPWPLEDGQPNWLVAPGWDQAKDQSYFLSLLEPERKGMVRFPLGGLLKSQCRKIVAECGLSPPIGKESQDICFINGRSGDYLAERLGAGAGDICLEEPNGSIRKIGRHQGLWNYTEGQRKGIGIPWKCSLYVSRKDAAENTLFVREGKVNLKGVDTGRPVLALPIRLWPEKVYARLRYRGKLAEASVRLMTDGMKIMFKEEYPASAPGQIASVTTRDGLILAGGKIEKLFFSNNLAR